MDNTQKHFLFAVLILALVITIGGLFASGNPLTWNGDTRGILTVLFIFGVAGSFYRHL